MLFVALFCRLRPFSQDNRTTRSYVHCAFYLVRNDTNHRVFKNTLDKKGNKWCIDLSFRGMCVCDMFTIAVFIFLRWCPLWYPFFREPVRLLILIPSDLVNMCVDMR